MCRQETHLEMQLLGQGTVSKKDIVVQPRNLAALGSLYRSVVRNPLCQQNISHLAYIQTWFAEELNTLKSSPEDAFSPTTPRLEPLTAATPYTPYLPLMPPILPHEQLKLPLSREMAL